MKRFTFLVAALLLCATAQAVDLRDLPDWVRSMIYPVWVDWEAKAQQSREGSGEVRVPVPDDLTGVIIGAPRTPAPAGAHGTVAVPGTVGLAGAGGGPTLPDAVTGPGGTVGVTGIGGPVTGGAIALPGPVTGAASGVAGVLPAEVTASGFATGTLDPVSMGDAAAQLRDVLGQITAGDADAVARAGVALSHAREMGAEDFVAWVHEEGVTAEVLTAALAMAGQKREDNYPVLSPECAAMSAALADLAGEDLSNLDAIPTFGRLWVAIHYAIERNEDAAGAAFDSITDEELVTLPRVPAVMTIAHLMHQVPGASVVAIERYAIATDQRVAWCSDLMFACTRVGTVDIIRAELLPYARSALEAMPPADRGCEALQALLCGYQCVDDHGRAATEGLRWLRALDSLGADIDSAAARRCRTSVAVSLAALGQNQKAADMLREVIGSSPPWSAIAGSAQSELLRLGQEHPEVGAARLLDPTLRSVWPEAITVSLRPGETASRAITVKGNATFDVTAVACDIPSVAASVTGERSLGGESAWRVDMAACDDAVAGRYTGWLDVTTNHAAPGPVRVPVEVVIPPVIAVNPSEICVGFLRLGETQKCEVRVASRVPFRVVGTDVDTPEFLTVDEDRSVDVAYTHVLHASVVAPTRSGSLSGQIRLRTDLAVAPEVVVPYYLLVLGAR